MSSLGNPALLGLLLLLLAALIGMAAGGCSNAGQAHSMSGPDKKGNDPCPARCASLGMIWDDTLRNYQGSPYTCCCNYDDPRDYY